MKLDKRYLDLARKITKDAQTMRNHLDVIKEASSQAHHNEEEMEFFRNWHQWLEPSLSAIEESKSKIIKFYQTIYPEGEPVEIKVESKTKKAK